MPHSLTPVSRWGFSENKTHIKYKLSKVTKQRTPDIAPAWLDFMQKVELLEEATSFAKIKNQQ